ncbi:MAG: EcsC family protein [Vulcanimicrobiota bacterium]
MEYDWSDYLTPDEREVLAEIEGWMSATPGSLKKLIGLAGKPLEFAYRQVPESIQNGISEAILKVLMTMRDGTTGMVSRRKVYDKIEAISGPLTGAGGILKVNIRTLDRVAKDCIKMSKAGCAAGGAAAGAAGLPGLIIDIPTLYGILFRMIQEVATVYGFSVKPEQEKSHILKILDVGHHPESTEKRKGMVELESIQKMIRDGTAVRDLERFAVQKGLQAMARSLGIHLTQRKLAQSVAIVGGLVGAGVNYQLAGDVSEVAYHAYRRRFLQEVALTRML